MNKELFKEKYRIKSSRLPHWNYSSNSWYFVTICIKNKMEHFGEVRNYIMGLSDAGCIAAKFWQDIPKHFTFVRLDEWVVMPNHLHGIVVIDKPNSANVETLQCNVSTDGKLNDSRNPKYPKNDKIHQFFSKISPKSQSLSTIIRSFKSIVTKTINQKHPEISFTWQSRFYDHIIRNEKSLNRIRKYIYDNPEKWELDRNNPENLWM